MTSTNGTNTTPAATINPLGSLESSLNQIFLAVGDFLEYNARTTSLGLEAYSRRPQDEAGRALSSNIQTFQSSCDALEIQIIRAKQVLRRELDAIRNPPKPPEEEKMEEVIEPEEPVSEEKMEEVNGSAEQGNGETGEETKPEEDIKEEDMNDEAGLFSEFDDLIVDESGLNFEWMDGV